LSFKKYLFEDFSHRGVPLGKKLEKSEEIESIRLASFEQGYRAGWDDAYNILSRDNLAISKALSSNLLDLRFTFEEAKLYVSSGISNLLVQIFTHLIPSISSENFNERVLGYVRDVCNETAPRKFTISVHPSKVPQLRRLLDEIDDIDIVLDSNGEFSINEVKLSMGSGSLIYDLDSAISKCKKIIFDCVDSGKETGGNPK